MAIEMTGLGAKVDDPLLLHSESHTLIATSLQLRLDCILLEGE